MMPNKQVMVDKPNQFSERKLRPLKKLLSDLSAVNANINGTCYLEDAKL